MTAPFEIVPAGDATVLVRFDERIDVALNARAVALANEIRRRAIGGVRDVVPTFRSVAVCFDPLSTDHNILIATLGSLAHTITPAEAVAAETIDVPVLYGGDEGPDLGEVARVSGVSQDEVVARHAAVVYRVFMLGFVPGFAYMGTVDDRIAVARRQTPRRRVPARSVGIAGHQTGIYPAETPGGWQIVGRAQVAPFDLTRADPFLFKPGDSVRFVPVDRL